jgi:hypothetical protein
MVRASPLQLLSFILQELSRCVVRWQGKMPQFPPEGWNCPRETYWKFEWHSRVLVLCKIMRERLLCVVWRVSAFSRRHCYFMQTSLAFCIIGALGDFYIYGVVGEGTQP